MFRYVNESAPPVGSRKAYVVPLSILTHLMLVAIAVVVPLFAPGVLPIPSTTLMAFISGEVPMPPPPPSPAPAPRASAAAPAQADDANPSAAPLDSPPAIAPEGVGQTTQGLVRGVEGVSGSVLDGVLGTRFEPSPPPAPAEPSTPIHVGGAVKPPAKIHDVAPIYPAIAQVAHVSGIVIIEATIGTSGEVLDAQVLRSISLLDGAALDAVRRWRFTPPMLNGTPIAVVMTVTVDFRLQ